MPAFAAISLSHITAAVFQCKSNILRKKNPNKMCLLCKIVLLHHFYNNIYLHYKHRVSGLAWMQGIAVLPTAKSANDKNYMDVIFIIHLYTHHRAAMYDQNAQ